MVLGVPGETDVSVSIVSQVGDTLHESTPVVGTTGAVPAGMPTPTVMDYDPERASPDRWLLGAVEADGGDDAYNKLVGNNSFVNDLYSFNGGPA